MYVGDGTWDATRNDFLLPNLVGLNFETMRYNGMGNRFKEMPQYYGLILAHGVIAVIAFLFIVPAAILTARFYGRSPGWALKWHIYLQVMTVLLSTVVFILGSFAVGSRRSYTNPHHGIGLAIYVLILVQAIGGWWVHSREKGKTRRKLPVKLFLHQWIGRAVALLGIAQVPLGLTLYGSPKFTFILYALWMTFLLVLYFVLSYRALPHFGIGARESSHGGTVIEDRKSSRFGGFLAPLTAGAVGAGAAALLSGRRRDRSRSRSRSRSRRDEVLPSRRGSGSYIEEEKFQSRRKESGTMDKVFKVAAAVGAGALFKSMLDRRHRKNEESEYSSVAPDTPSRRHGRNSHYNDTEISEDSRMEQGRRPRNPILPGPGDPVAAASAMSAAEARPHTPRPLPSHSHGRQTSYDSNSYYDSEYSPSRHPQSTHGVRNGLLAGLGLGWFAKKMKDRRDKREMDRLDRIEAERIESERLARHGSNAGGSRLTGDGFPTPIRKHRPQESNISSDLSSIIDNPHSIRPGASIPPVPSAMAGGSAAAHQPGSGSNLTEPLVMPSAPPDPQGILHQDSESETYMSSGGQPRRRPSARRRREGEKAAAVAVAAGLAAEEEARRHRSRSRGGEPVTSPPVSVKVKVHGDKDRNVTLRRLTEQEAAAEREVRKNSRQRRRRADSLSSLSGTDTAISNRRYRRSERAAEKRAEASVPPPPAMAPLDPPSPAFAGGRKPKDSAYYSGRPGESSALGGDGSVGSHGTWSGMSPGSGKGSGRGSTMSEDAAERRRRRRLERSQKPTGTVDFT
ncbi:Cytochrome b561 domain-containing protein [Lachnellula subtilissima]|uniref:Cytochrome b561 domain-containing protein n=1 Tax=Lachnellula subtilissima TaxID=602034 RepID=A0A8H8RV97_9HELO|nr:Cytochrome b561 domain-containing protein [Lachnellula subtilissima]